MRHYNVPLEIILMSVDEACSEGEVHVEMLAQNWSFDAFYSSGATDLHRHEYVELMYVYEGCCKINTEQDTIVLHEKDICLIDRDALHQDDLRDTHFTVLCVCISTDYFDAFVLQRENGVSKPLPGFILDALRNKKSGNPFLRLKAGQMLSEVEDALAQICIELQRKRCAYEQICQGYLLRLLDALSPEVYNRLPNESKSQFRQQLFSSVIAYMTDHMTSVTPEDLVRVFHFQKDYFNRLIRAYTECSFTQTLQRIRMSRAEYLLAHTNLPVLDIVHQTGYNNTGYFYRIFFERHQMTPAAYRSLWKK